MDRDEQLLAEIERLHGVMRTAADELDRIGDEAAPTAQRLRNVAHSSASRMVHDHTGLYLRRAGRVAEEGIKRVGAAMAQVGESLKLSR